MSERIQITRRLEFDAGHRIPDHGSQCRHLHGHRYAIEITVDGPVHDTPGQPDNGMVLDFADVKALIHDTVVEPWDHAFLAWREDQAVLAMLATIPGHKTVVLDAVPTAENLASEAFRLIKAALHLSYGDNLRLARVRLYETPNCWSDVVR
jgi:6-pyruvoyltetrahydropterin/6-carboxytetrahydropterin synthase